MSYTILSAVYANEDRSAAVLTTAEAGAVAVSQADTPQLWVQMLQGTVQPFPLPSLAEQIAVATVKIDADADAVRDAVIGGRATEYQAANDEATAFKAAGYVGTVPPTVQSWVDAKAAGGTAWTAQQAADDILLTAAQWTAAQNSIRANRLLRKEQARVAATQAALDAAMTAWAGFVAAIRAQLDLPAQ